MKLLALIFLWIFAFIGCDQPTQFERDNSNDPSSNEFEPDSLKNFTYSVLDDHASLKWELGSNFIENYLLGKTNVSGEFEKLKILDKNTNSYNDYTISPFSGIYRIQFLGPSGPYNTPDLTYKYDIGSTNFSFSNNALDSLNLIWENNTYFNTTAVLEVQTHLGTYEQLSVVPGHSDIYTVTNLSQNSIGINSFRHTEYSDIDVSESLYTSEIRLPFWDYPGTISNVPNRAYMVKLQNSVYGFTNDSGNFGNKSFKFDINDFNAEIIKSPPNFGNNHPILSLDVIGSKIIALSYTDNYAIYEPSSNSWVVYNEPLIGSGPNFSTLNLDENRLFVTGRGNLIFDLPSNTWTRIPPLNSFRKYHSSILLDDGNIFVAGEKFEDEDNNSAEIYSFEQEKWIKTPNASIQIYRLIKLKNGKVLALGQYESIEYDPVNNVWVNRKRYDLDDHITRGISSPILHLLPDGNVMLAGLVKKGIDNTYGEGTKSQIYIPETNEWRRISDLKIFTRELSLPITLDNSNVLLIHNRHNWDGLHYEVLGYSLFR